MTSETTLLVEYFAVILLRTLKRNRFQPNNCTRWVALLVCSFQVELEFRKLVFVEEEKREDLEKDSWSKDKNQRQTQTTCEPKSRNSAWTTVVGGKHSTCSPPS